MIRVPGSVLCLLFAAAAAFAGPAPARAPLYDPQLADQFPAPRLGDTVPADAVMREMWARNLAYEATIYGQPAVLTWRQVHAQAIDRAHPGHVGFNRFAHGRELAGPGYAPFKSPNADTLYSNAYLDLRDGPVLLDVPDMQGRYYTANFLDMFGNATNIGTRTAGASGGRYLIATTDWAGEVPPGRTVFRVASPFMWILLRVLVHHQGDLARARVAQDRFVLGPTRPTPGEVTNWPRQGGSEAADFLRTLDFVLRNAGYPRAEAALVHRFDGIGIAGERSLEAALLDPPIRTGIEAGYADAQKLIASAIVQNGRRVGAWSEPLDVGRYGYNYLYRAALNTLGTGANVIEENYPFTTFESADGKRLSGLTGPYELRLSPPPPARFFWSVTVYDAATRELHPNPAGKYTVGDRTPGLRRGRDGSVTIRFSASARAGERPEANVLPVPAGPFYVAIRAQGPLPQLLERRWLPPAIQRTAQ